MPSWPLGTVFRTNESAWIQYSRVLPGFAAAVLGSVPAAVAPFSLSWPSREPLPVNATPTATPPTAAVPTAAPSSPRRLNGDRPAAASATASPAADGAVFSSCGMPDFPYPLRGLPPGGRRSAGHSIEVERPLYYQVRRRCVGRRLAELRIRRGRWDAPRWMRRDLRCSP